MPVIANFENVSKRYRLGARQNTLRDALASLPGHFMKRNSRDKSRDKYIWAIKDVSFDLERGQVLGIIGANGAGKTTLLKLLSRVTRPTTGRIRVNGRVSALIELGAGFHPDLTGRENVYLNGVILGLTKKEIDRKFDKIVEFAELEEFIDTPVKRYSSGMYARLGFSVAAHVDPDLLLVDEVLAVGDVSFQRRCFDHIHSFVTGGNTAVFVSHNLYAIEQLCNHVIWLDRGHIVMSSDPATVLTAYLDTIDQRELEEAGLDNSPVGGDLQITRVSFADGEGQERQTFFPGEDLIVQVDYHTPAPLPSPHFCLVVMNSQASLPLFQASMLADGHAPPSVQGAGTVRCRFKAVPLKPGAYHLWGEVYGADRTRLLVEWRRLGAFRIAATTPAQTEVGKGSIRHSRADAPVHVPYEWEL